MTQQGVDLNTAIDTAKTQLQTQVADVQTQVGRAAVDPTQSDVDAIINLLQTQGAYDAQYDFNGDKVVDQNDKVAVDQYMRRLQPNYIPDRDEAIYNPAATSKWAPTGIYAEVEEEAAKTRAAQATEAAKIRQVQAAEAARTRAAGAAAAAKTQRMGNINTLQNMMMQAPDTGGQQVSVATPDAANIGYVYDWGSIFANPSQQKMFTTPYARGGAVRNDLDDVNDELLKLMGG